MEENIKEEITKTALQKQDGEIKLEDGAILLTDEDGISHILEEPYTEKKSVKKKKNHWTKTKVDSALKRINSEIYKRNREASIRIKIDDMSVFVNSRIQKKGIAKGMVCIQEKLNLAILALSNKTSEILLSNDPKKQVLLFQEMEFIIKTDIWNCIRFLMINHGLTPGEISELIGMQCKIDKEIEKWKNSIVLAISANRSK